MIFPDFEKLSVKDKLSLISPTVTIQKAHSCKSKLDFTKIFPSLSDSKGKMAEIERQIFLRQKRNHGHNRFTNENRCSEGYACRWAG